MSLSGFIPHEQCERCGYGYPSSVMQTYALEPSEDNQGPLTSIRACLICVSEMAAKRLGQKEPYEFPGDMEKQRDLALTKTLRESQGGKGKRRSSGTDEEDILKSKQEEADAKLAEQQEQVNIDRELDEKGAEEREAQRAGTDAEADAKATLDAKKRGKAPEDEDTEDMVDKSEPTKGSSGKTARRNS